MRFLSFLFLSLYITTSFFVVSSFAQESSYPVLSSQHKFFAHKEKGESTTGKIEKGIILLSRGTGLIKRRPKNFGIALLPKSIGRKLSAKSAVVLDAQTGKVLYARNPDKPAQPASTIKVLTGLISIDSLNDQDMVPVSRRAARMPRSKIYLRNGKKYPANDLINAVLLASANDASVALAEKIAGSEKVFARLMTAKARSFGARNTVCKTANGLTAKGQHSTARDLALIFSKAMENKSFAAKMTKRRIKNRTGGMVYSHNKALWRISGAVGGKTGYTNAARQTYVGKFKRGESEIVIAFLGSETMWKDAKHLVEYGFAKKSAEENFATVLPDDVWPSLSKVEEGDALSGSLLLSNLRQE